MAEDAAPSLRHARDSEPGIRRIARGRGWRYLHADGRPVGAVDRARIEALAVPPAWVEVWISADPATHLQATGRDARGRKQYRYHPRWRERRERGKFDRVLALVPRLPALRRRITRDLGRPGLPRERVLAVAVSLLGRTLTRVGSAEYAATNGTYGLSTLRNRHLDTHGSGIRLRFRGKQGRAHRIAVDDARLARLLRRCQALPGQHLFEYIDDAGGIARLDSCAINDYLREATGGEFTAKDIRTLDATLCALALCARSIPARSERGRRRRIQAVVAEVAAMLGNTPAVCRASYIHPGVFGAWQEGRLAGAVAASGARGPRRWERIALRLLKPRRVRGR